MPAELRSVAGRVAVVTGAASGIGRATAALLAEDGGKVAALDRAEPPIPDGGDAWTVDLTDQGAVDAVLAEVRDQLGPVDILVNDAAVTFFIPVETFPKKRFDLMFEVQVWAPFHLTQLVLPSMRERKQGWITNISSGAAIHPQQPYNRRGGGTVYGMCKAALERFTTGLASEVYEDNIAVNVISPGLVDTPGVAVHGLITEATKSRVTPIEYIAEAVHQLSTGDPKTMTGRIDHAAPFLQELKLKPSELV